MPDFDTGHLFLTYLVPIRSDSPPSATAPSYVQRVRDALALFPTARQSPATVDAKYNSPFARNLRNHFVRIFVLDDVVYNGRVGQDAILATIKGINTIVPQEVDRLNAAYMVFAADIDAISKNGDPLPLHLSPAEQARVRRDYAHELWATMRQEMTDILRNCHGFDPEKITTADDFANYMAKCHVETTMPFHDYYLELPKFHLLPAKALLAVVAVPAVAGLIALVLWLFGFQHLPILGWGALATSIIAFVLTAIAAALSVKYAIANGEKPLAPGKYDDLPSVLKALYIQQSFADFVAMHQGVDDADLHKAFGQFLAAHKPAHVFGPTQPPGEISFAHSTQHTSGALS